MTTNNAVREATKIVTAHRQTEGGGFLVRRPIPTQGLELADPFLLLDEMGPSEYGPGEAVGAPDHPHRGFETVTYMLDGEFEHEDSAGHRGLIRPGDVQWMTAGAGIIHSEMPSRQIREQGGRVHGFQIWVNLPARLKMSRPRYQEVPASRIPEAQSEDGRARVRVIAGEVLGPVRALHSADSHRPARSEALEQAPGVRAVIGTHTPIVFQDWTVDAGADVTTLIPRDHQVIVYVFGGSVLVGSEGREVHDGQLAVLGAGDAVRLRGSGLLEQPLGAAPKPARLLLLAGVPLAEPVARYGPFVMNTREEIHQAVRDFQSGRMGEITRTAEVR